MTYKNIEDKEQAFERMLELTIPNFSNTYYKGASLEEVKKIEESARQELPGFYYWFLLKISKSEEILKYYTSMFAPMQVLAGFRPLFKGCDEDPSNIPRGLFCIGMRENYNCTSPGYYYYDLKKSIRDDAPILIHFDCEIEVTYETSREMMAKFIFLSNKYFPSANKESGYFIIRSLDRMRQLEDLLKSLGAESLVPSGNYFKLIKLNTTFISFRIDVECYTQYQVHFNACGKNQSEISEVLKTIGTRMGLDLYVKDEYSYKMGEYNYYKKKY